jgi:hypothetical protein
MSKTAVVFSTLAATLALCAPAQARSAPTVGVGSHVRAAGVAAERVDAAIDRRALVRARAALATNRRETGLAVAAAARLIRAASTPAERLRAAKAVVAIARLTGSSERRFAKAVRLVRLGSDLQQRLSAAIACDAARFARASARLRALSARLPAPAQRGLARALAVAAAAHGAALREVVVDTTSRRVARGAKRSAAGSLGPDVRGEARALENLLRLRASAPAPARPGLSRAIAMLRRNLARQAARLEAAHAHTPRGLHRAIGQAAAAARAAAHAR